MNWNSVSRSIHSIKKGSKVKGIEFKAGTSTSSTINVMIGHPLKKFTDIIMILIFAFTDLVTLPMRIGKVHMF